MFSKKNKTIQPRTEARKLVCAYCGKPFITRAKKVVCCKRECYAKWYKENVRLQKAKVK